MIHHSLFILFTFVSTSSCEHGKSMKELNEIIIKYNNHLVGGIKNLSVKLGKLLG
jgi:hypothetical protein